MSKETCPYCGSDRNMDFTKSEVYDCATNLDPFDFSRSNQCYERQLAQKDAEIEKLLNTLFSLC